MPAAWALPDDAHAGADAYGYLPNDDAPADGTAGNGILLGVNDGRFAAGDDRPQPKQDSVVSASAADQAVVPTAPPITSVPHATRYLRVGTVDSEPVTLPIEYFTPDQPGAWSLGS